MKGRSIIGVVSSKGGAGKSVMTRGLAVQGVIEGHRSAILDCDRQKTCWKWSLQRKKIVGEQPPSCVALEELTVGNRIDELQGRGAELIVIDTPPHNLPLINIVIEE